MSTSEVHFLRADDGVPLTLVRVRGEQEPTKGPVLLIHGAGMRAESFRPRGAHSIVDALVAEGWDVWMLNWRGSIDLDPVPWTFDDVALFDHPAAVRHIMSMTDAAAVKVIAHCAGAASISMSVVAGLVPEVDVVVANGVSLHPLMPGFAKVKLDSLRRITRRSFVDIAWGDGPEKGFAKVTRNAIRGWHAECRNGTCNLASFALGSGHPALWLHANLSHETHEWLRDEFGKVPMSFYAQLAASARSGRFVTLGTDTRLPRRYGDAAPRSDARFALFTGAHNRAYLPASQHATHAYLEAYQPGRHTLRVLPRYSHTDLFWGARARADVFPAMIGALSPPTRGA